MISNLAKILYADSPDDLLYHYTTLKGLKGIISSRCLWASDVRYMNDSAELNYIIALLQERVRFISTPSTATEVINHFVDWMSYRITNGHMVFAASFRADGNLLSQWRGYSSVGKGISIGFNAQDIKTLATANGFKLGRCIYEKDKQIKLIDSVLSSISDAIAQDDAYSCTAKREKIFETVEADMLSIAALFKHPSFAEEKEWRIVSPAVTDYLEAPVNFREGASMMIPYYEFPLLDKHQQIPISHLFLGPTPNRLLSLNSLKLYLEKSQITPAKGIDYCEIPYRNR